MTLLFCYFYCLLLIHHIYCFYLTIYAFSVQHFRQPCVVLKVRYKYSVVWYSKLEQLACSQLLKPWSSYFFPDVSLKQLPKWEWWVPHYLNFELFWTQKYLPNSWISLQYAKSAAVLHQPADEQCAATGKERGCVAISVHCWNNDC